MQVAKKNAGKARKEAIKRSTEISRAEAKKRYINELKENPLFQEFVLADWKAELDRLLDIRTYPNGNYEELGKLVVQMKAASAILEKLMLPFKR